MHLNPIKPCKTGENPSFPILAPFYSLSNSFPASGSLFASDLVVLIERERERKALAIPYSEVAARVCLGLCT